MKKFIIIFYVLLSLSLYSKTDKQNDIEIGAGFGIFTSSGLFIDYNIIDDLSIKASGFIIIREDDATIYEYRLSLLYSMVNNKNLNFYLISSVFKGRSIPPFILSSSSSDIEIQGFSAGLGLKFKLSEITNFIFEFQGIKTLVNNYKWHYLPNINFGFSFNL